MSTYSVLRTLSFWAVVLIAVALMVFFAQEMVSAA